MNWENILDMAYNGKTGIEFSWNMTLRAFIHWLLDQELWKYAVLIGAVLFIILLYKFWLTFDK